MAHNGYARTPLEVYTDPRLSAYAVRVYCVLAGTLRETSNASIGIRRIAQLAAMSKSRAQDSIEELLACGHVATPEVDPGRRSVYVLASPVFGQKQGKVQVVRVAKSGGKILTSVGDKIA